MQRKPDNLSDSNTADGESCSICRDLLANLGRFFDMLETARRSEASDWLTVDDIAQELRISKSIVYRLIRQGELEAIDIVVKNNGTAAKGHYRIRRSALNRYLESKMVVSRTALPKKAPRTRRFPEVKNHLGL